MSQQRDKVFKFPRIRGVSDGAYLRTKRHRINVLCNELGLKSWVDIVLTRMHSWAGHLARLHQQFPHRLASQVLVLKCMQHSATVAALNNQRSQLHPARYFVHTWE